jgi:hypothetical protein
MTATITMRPFCGGPCDGLEERVEVQDLGPFVGAAVFLPNWRIALYRLEADGALMFDSTHAIYDSLQDYERSRPCP